MAGTGNEDPEVRMLEKRSKVIEELLQTEKDYIKDLQMCVEEIIEPLQKKQVKKNKADLNYVRLSREGHTLKKVGTKACEQEKSFGLEKKFQANSRIFSKD